MGRGSRPDRQQVGENVAVAKTLTVFLAADVSKLSRGLKSADADMQGFSGTLNKLVGPALLATVAAAGALAIKLGIDGVKAAVEDEAAVARLAQTLGNLGLAHDTTKVEDYIRVLERSLGIADTELRPAYDRLVRSIGDTELANDALALSLDISAGSGKSLDAVVQALGRAYDGNVAGLSRLGAGIDAATLRTGDMQQITAALSATFAGQAQTAAGTYEGQVKRLSTAADNMKEAFGAGLLKNLGDTDAATQRLVDRMGSFEVVLEDVGAFVGDLVLGLEDLASSTEDLAKKQTVAEKQGIKLRDQTQSLTDAFFANGASIEEGIGVALLTLITNQGRSVRSTEAAIEATRLLEAGYRAATGATEGFTRASYDTAEGLRVSYNAFIKMAQVTANTTRVTADQAERTATATTRVTQLAASTQTYTGSAGAAATATTITTDKFAEQEGVLKGLNSQLQQQTKDLESATGAIAAYAQNVANQITRGFDLSAGLTITDGQANAAEWLSGVDAEVAKYQWFGNVLTEIERQGGPELRDYFAGLGADVGGEMGQAAISGGLVPQLANKLAEVQQAAFSVGQSMVPEFLLAGEESAIEFVNGTVKQIEKEEKRLRQIGKNIGKPIGANIKAEIAQAVADAIKAAEASRTAALAEISAREAATTAGAVEQATAQSLARLIRNSDNRAGRNVQPVLA
jgi:hypothetical protein